MDSIGYSQVYFLGGGAGAGFVYLGLMKALRDLRIDSGEILWVGTSIGAFFAAALAKGMSYREARSRIRHEKGLIGRIMIPTPSEVISSRFSGRDGLESPEKLEHLAGNIFDDMPLGEFSNICILASYHNGAHKILELDPEHYPDLPVKKAISASATIMPVFSHEVLNYHGEKIELQDGGQADGNPVNIVIPQGYTGNIISIGLLGHARTKRIMSFLGKRGLIPYNEHPEPYREDLNVTELNPLIPPSRFADTTSGNIRKLKDLGYDFFMEYLPEHYKKSA